MPCTMRRSLSLVLLAVILLLLSVSAQGEVQEDEWADLDDSRVSYESLPDHNKASAQQAAPVVQEPQSFRRKLLPYSMAFFLGVSLLTGLWGARANAKLTLAFEEQFCRPPDGIFWKQFTRLGKGNDSKKLLVGDSSSMFKLHCRGHQHLEGAVFTMNLRRRHELLSSLFEWLTGVEDSICLEFYLKEGVIPPMVLAIASNRNYKELLKTNQDVRDLAPLLTVDENILKDWPKEELVVYAEHPSYFYDMMTRPMMAQVFGAAPFRKLGKYFRGVQISSDSNSQHRKIMRWWLSLPGAEEMGDLQTLMQALFAMLSQINDYKISPERRQKAEKARQELVSGGAKTKGQASSKQTSQRR